MFSWAIRNGIVVAVIALVICVLGLAAMLRVPVQMIPDMDQTTLSVVTRWPGASPQDVEREILIEQEEYLRTLPGLRKMTASASTGEATVELEFALGSDLNQVLTRTNNALSQVPGYPENVDEPRILTSAFSDNYFLFFIIRPLEGNPKHLDLPAQLDFIEDQVQMVLERSQGVGEVRLGGGAARQMQVFVDPAALAQRRISVAQLRSALRQRNQDVSGGDLDSGKRRFLVRTLGRFHSAADIESTIIARRDGVPVYLRDLGYARLGHAEIRTESYFGDEPSIMVSIKRQRGANIVAITRDVKAKVARLNESVLKPHGLRMDYLHSDASYITESITVIGQNLLLGGLLAVGVLFVYLRSAPATLIGAIGIPVCTIGAFIGLLLAGRTINVVSLAGIAFAIGMTLDNSIVVLENTHRQLRDGLSGAAAALAGVSQVWSAVLASTLTTLLVFVPVLMVRQEAGQIYSDIAIAMAAAILFSLWVAVTVVPSASSVWLGGTAGAPASPGALHRFGGIAQESVLGAVRWLVTGVWRPMIYIAVVLILTGAIIWQLTPRAEYLPEGEEPSIFTLIFPPPGYNLAAMSGIAADLRRQLVPHLGQEPSLFASGQSDVPALRWVLQSISADRVFLLSGTRRSADIDPMIDLLSRRTARYPGMISFSTRGSIFSGNDGGTRSLDLNITGSNLHDIFAVAMEAFLKIRAVLHDPQIRPAPSSLQLGQPQLLVQPDWERAAELGISAGDLGYQVWALTDGAYVDDYYLDNRKADLYLYSTRGTVKRPQDLASLPVYAPKAGIVPLGAIARITETVNTDTIRRVNAERTVTLTVVSPHEVPLESAVNIIQQEVIDTLRQAGKVPPGVKLQIGGASDKMAATRIELTDNMLLAVALVYLLMVAVFRHWGYPFIILLTVPLGVAGGILGLHLMNLLPGVSQPFDMITMLGFLVLVGVVVNNPILLVERARANLAEGMVVRDAIVEAVQSRVRPITMTTVTTVFGLAPLVFVPRAGTELYRGLGIVVLFGLLFSTLVTLTLIPALLAVLTRWRAGSASDAARV